MSHDIRKKMLQHVNMAKGIAKRYANGFYGVDYDDMVQEGMIGLWKAIVEFDPERGHGNFKHYARLLIRRECRAKIGVEKKEDGKYRLKKCITDSLSKPLDGDEDYTILDTLVSPNRNPEEVFVLREETITVNRAIAKLDLQSLTLLNEIYEGDMKKRSQEHIRKEKHLVKKLSEMVEN